MPNMPASMSRVPVLLPPAAAWRRKSDNMMVKITPLNEFTKDGTESSGTFGGDHVADQMQPNHTGAGIGDNGDDFVLITCFVMGVE